MTPRRASKACVDSGFKDDVAIHGAVRGIDVEQVKRGDITAGFVPLKRRWVVEQTNGTLMLHRRLTRGDESRPASSVSRTLWVSTRQAGARIDDRREVSRPATASDRRRVPGRPRPPGQPATRPRVEGLRGR